MKTVTIDYNKGNPTCSDSPVRVTFDPTRPLDADEKLRWKVENTPPGMRVKIMWEVAGPFLEVEERPGGDFVARGNIRIPGYYEYAVLFLDGDGQVRAGIDPKIVNDPEPPN